MSRSRSRFPSLVVLAIVAVLAFVLNPSAEKHHAAIKEAVKGRSVIAGMLGAGSLAAWATGYHSLGLCSYTKANDRIISIGAFGIVHVRDLLPE